MAEYQKTYTSRGGKRIIIAEMTNRHLDNAINYFKEMNVGNTVYKEYAKLIAALEHEKEERKKLEESQKFSSGYKEAMPFIL